MLGGCSGGGIGGDAGAFFVDGGDDFLGEVGLLEERLPGGFSALADTGSTGSVSYLWDFDSDGTFDSTSIS